MLLKEWLATNNIDIWDLIITELGENKSQFISHPEIMTTQLAFKYGERILFKPFEEINPLIIAKTIAQTFGDIWNSQFNITTLNNGLGSKTVNSSSDSTGIKNIANTGKVKNQVSAYNTDSLIDDSATVNDLSSDENSTINNTGENITYSVKDAYNDLTIVQKQLIIDTIQLNVAETLTISIY